ncbi:MAG TPA: FKBP-type peptidyl-prolyl cis-trans isomerase [Candidatus Paceibacterota bacterium]|nr:FKBP-type peptidyl-prolyl cis-trans isomerase [Candidatus Paceibacterota bacterium]
MNSKTIAILIVIILIIAGGGWYFYSTSNTTPAPATQQTATSTTATTTPQVQAQDITVGTGTEAVPGSVVSVLYIGKLQNGTVFDSSAAHGNKPLSFTLGQQGLIAGFQIGVNGMKVGGERVMAIPPELGYGAQAVTDASGTTIIPANSTILFDVKLVGVQAPGAATSTTGTKTK